MECEPLTREEAAWMRKLEKLFGQCPSARLECYTTGDADLTFYDKNVYNEYEDGMPRNNKDVGWIVSESGAYLSIVNTNIAIISAAG